MTSLRQIESNRRNAQKSTGPRTDSGKQRASQNAVRHGLTAETVIKPLEDADDYQAFELAVTADYDAETAVERELVLRLASLLWRLRRATSIETSLLQIQDEFLPEPGGAQQPQSKQDCEVITMFQPDQDEGPLQSIDGCSDANDSHAATQRKQGHSSEATRTLPHTYGLEVARRFLSLADLDNGAFERLGRYEAALWRQVRQTVFTLEAMRCRASSARHWRRRDRWQRTSDLPLGND
jgi:hypothetical protein